MAKRKSHVCTTQTQDSDRDYCFVGGYTFNGIEVERIRVTTKAEAIRVITKLIHDPAVYSIRFSCERDKAWRSAQAREGYARAQIERQVKEVREALHAEHLRLTRLATDFRFAGDEKPAGKDKPTKSVQGATKRKAAKRTKHAPIKNRKRRR